MWMLESFATIELLIDFLNDRRLTADQCKIVAARDDDGNQVFHVLYQSLESVLAEVAVAQAGIDQPSADDAEDAVDAAEAIIADAQRDE